ncbi:MAG: lipase family protein, partial [Pseudomonadota bacterium]
MKTFDRGFARLLLEICRYAYAAGQDTEDRKDALNRIRKAGGLLADEPVILQGSETSIACIASYSDRNIVSYISRKNQFDTLDTTMISIKNWSDHFKTLLTP